MADRRLQVFHTVARLLSFTKAAESLHMTQPAVTFQVRQLEEYFNTRLFDRTHNKVNLTPAGKKVYEFADRIFDLYDEMENSVRELTGEISGALTIGASTTIAEYMLPTLLGEFKAKYPDVAPKIKVAELQGLLAVGGFPAQGLPLGKAGRGQFDGRCQFTLTDRLDQVGLHRLRRGCSLYQVALGMSFGIVVGKLIYGGSGRYLVNQALLALGKAAAGMCAGTAEVEARHRRFIL